MESIAEFLSSHDLRVGWLPDWATGLIVLALAVLLALWLHSVAYIVLDRAVRAEDLFRRSVLLRTRALRGQGEDHRLRPAELSRSAPAYQDRSSRRVAARESDGASALLTMSGLWRHQPRKRGILHMSGTLFRAAVLALREGGLSCQIA